MSGLPGVKRALAVGAGTATLLFGALLVPQSASAAVLDCDTFTHHNDPDLGIAFCTNDSNRTMKFRAVVVCGRAFDVDGQWVTLHPGQSGQSQGKCAFYSTGVGAIGVDERNA